MKQPNIPDPDPKSDRRASSLRRWAAAHGQQLQQLLLDWFDQSGRNLPWRSSKDPYRIWLSEIMLQQTQVITVIPYFNRFIKNWPTISDLAAAEQNQVLKAWEGLGYYSRAQNLLKTAKMICADYGGLFPEDKAALKKLPGIGDYTAGAVASIAFGQPCPAVDGNVLRVLSRLCRADWTSQVAAQRKEIESFAERIIPEKRPGDFNEALMDLGAAICLPRQPACAQCPVSTICRAWQDQVTDQYPLRKPAVKVPVYHRIVIIQASGCHVQVRRRPAHGLLANLYAFDWLVPPEINEEAGSWQLLTGDQHDNLADLSQMPDSDLIRQGLNKLLPDRSIVDLGLHRHVFSHKIWQLHGFLVFQPGLILAESGPVQGTLQGWIDPAGLTQLPFARALSVYRDRWLTFLAQSADT